MNYRLPRTLEIQPDRSILSVGDSIARQVAPWRLPGWVSSGRLHWSRGADAAAGHKWPDQVVGHSPKPWAMIMCRRVRPSVGRAEATFTC